MKIDRAEASRALAKCLAFHAAAKPQEAQFWAERLVKMLRDATILPLESEARAARGERP